MERRFSCSHHDGSTAVRKAHFIAARGTTMTLEPHHKPSDSWAELWLEVVGSKFSADTCGEECWRVCLHSRIFRLMFRRSVKGCLRRFRNPSDWEDDLESQALLELKATFQRLSRSPPNYPIPLEAFREWITVVVDRTCLDALRKLLRLYRRESELSDWECADKSLGGLDLRLDLRQALDALPEPTCTVMRSLAEGRSLVEIAESLGLSYKKVRYCRKMGIANLRRTLGGYRCDQAHR